MRRKCVLHIQEEVRMASIEKHGNKFRAQVYVRGSRSSKVFATEQEAHAWAAETENNLRQKVAHISRVTSGILKFPRSILKARMEAPLTHEEIVKGATPTSRLSGIYFLIRAGRVVYVGQSVNVFRRLSEHIKNGFKFDAFTISLCDPKDLDRLESTYIRAIFPEDNLVYGAPSRKRKATLYAS
jgi:hypothetical protein